MTTVLWALVRTSTAWHDHGRRVGAARAMAAPCPSPRRPRRRRRSDRGRAPSGRLADRAALGAAGQHRVADGEDLGRRAVVVGEAQHLARRVAVEAGERRASAPFHA